MNYVGLASVTLYIQGAAHAAHRFAERLIIQQPIAQITPEKNPIGKRPQTDYKLIITKPELFRSDCIGPLPKTLNLGLF